MAQSSQFNVKESYEQYSTGKKTINEIADEYEMDAQQVAEQFNTYVQGSKKDK